VSLFRFVKYSSILYFLGKHRSKLFRSAAVLLFAFVTSLLYDDLRLYLESQHPESLIYALIAKIVIVYGSLIFVLLQFRPDGSREKRGEERAAALPGASAASKAARKGVPGANPAADRLDALADVDSHQKLRTRYDQVLAGERHVASPTEPDAKT
jgi:hypothetical protein